MQPDSDLVGAVLKLIMVDASGYPECCPDHWDEGRESVIETLIAIIFRRVPRQYLVESVPCPELGDLLAKVEMAWDTKFRQRKLNSLERRYLADRVARIRDDFLRWY